MTTTTIDQRDNELLFARIAARANIDGARVGDWCRLPDDNMVRFTHDWGDDLQTDRGQGLGSFYFSRCGFMDYSGGLDRALPRDRLHDTGAMLAAPCWFFHHDRPAAHNGVTVSVPCRVFELR